MAFSMIIYVPVYVTTTPAMFCIQIASITANSTKSELTNISKCVRCNASCARLSKDCGAWLSNSRGAGCKLASSETSRGRLDTP